MDDAYGQQTEIPRVHKSAQCMILDLLCETFFRRVEPRRCPAQDPTQFLLRPF